LLQRSFGRVRTNRGVDNVAGVGEGAHGGKADAARTAGNENALHLVVVLINAS
jgi:hypothetical protein